MKFVCKCDKCGAEGKMEVSNGVWSMPEQWVEIGWPEKDRVLCDKCSELYSKKYVEFLIDFFGKVHGNELTKLIKGVSR